MNDLVNKYIELFPEESLYAGLNKQANIEFKDQTFLGIFQKHLSYYENELYPNKTEKLYKVANLIFYSLIMDNPLDDEHSALLHKFAQNSGTGKDNLATKLAYNYLKKVQDAYNKHFVNFGQLGPVEIAPIQLGDYNNIQIHDYIGWQRTLYGIDTLSKDVLIGELVNEVDWIAKTPHRTSYVNISFEQIQELMSLLFGMLGIPLPKTTIQCVPSYLAEAIPIAAAYWPNRLKSGNQSFVVLVNTGIKMPVGLLLMVIAHEVLGHINHFNLVNKYCTDSAKKIPYLSRLPLTEGVGLLAEDAFVNLVQKDNSLLSNMRRIVKAESASTDDIKNEVLVAHKRARVRRITRYLFELSIYHEGQGIESTIKDLSERSGTPFIELHEDLTSYLVTPGYASCYTGGYKLLQGKIDLMIEADRKKLGEFGFNFIQLLS